MSAGLFTTKFLVGKALPALAKTAGAGLVTGLAVHHGQRLAGVYGFGEDVVDAAMRVAGFKKRDAAASVAGAPQSPPALQAPTAAATVAATVGNADTPPADPPAEGQVPDVGCGCTANDTPEDLRAALNTVLAMAVDEEERPNLPDASTMAVGSWLDTARHGMRTGDWSREGRGDVRVRHRSRRSLERSLERSRRVLSDFKARAHARVERLQQQLRDARGDADRAALQAQIDALKAQQEGALALQTQLQTQDPRAAMLAQQIAQFEAQPALFDARFQAMSAQPSFLEQLRQFKEAAALIASPTAPPAQPQSPAVIVVPPQQQMAPQQPVILAPGAPMVMPQYGAPMVDPFMPVAPMDPMFGGGGGYDINMELAAMAVPPDLGGIGEKPAKACAVKGTGPLASIGIADPDAVDVAAIAAASGAEMDCGCS